MIFPKRFFARAPLVRAMVGACLAGGALFGGSQSASAALLDTIKSRGMLICGVHPGQPGFGQPDANGRYKGLDIDFCRALAAVVFNDIEKIRFIPTTGTGRFPAVQSGEVDVLTRNATYTLSRDTSLGLNFPAINFYDGQGFLVKRSAKIDSVKDLAGASICVAQGTTTELNLADYFRTHALKYEGIAFGNLDEASKALETGRCDAFTTDSSGLAAQRLTFGVPDDFVILPEIISKEPLGPAIRKGDEQWTTIVRWTHYAMLNAEELGVTKDNVDAMLTSPNPEIRRLLGVEGSFGEGLGLSKDWAYRIVKLVGNYGESFERNVGPTSPLEDPARRQRARVEGRAAIRVPDPLTSHPPSC